MAVEKKAMSSSSSIANRLIFGRYGMSQIGMDKLYTQMSDSEYVTMEQIVSLVDEAGDGTRIYMKDLSEQLDVPVTKLSHTVSGLEEGGLVAWQHDPDSDRGTYIIPTESGRQRLKTQEQILNDFYHKVVKDFGENRAINLAMEMAALTQTMRLELNREE